MLLHIFEWKRFTFLCKLCSQENSIRTWRQLWCSGCWIYQQIFLDRWFSTYWNWRTSGINHKAVVKINANWRILSWQNFKVTKKVIDCLPPQNVSQSTVTFSKDGGNIQQTLMIHSNIIDDNFFFSSKIKDLPPTTRRTLDPIALLAPFVLKAKLLLYWLTESQNLLGL